MTDGRCQSSCCESRNTLGTGVMGPCLAGMTIKLLPHPVLAPVAFPSGEAALAKLQEQLVVVIEIPGAEIARRREYLVAGLAADIFQRRIEGSGSFSNRHAEGERHIV